MSDQIGLKKVVFAAVAALGAAVSFGVTTYYAGPGVSPGSGSGTEDDPFDLYTAVSMLAQKPGSAVGDTVLIKAGTYTMSDFMPDGESFICYDKRTGADSPRNQKRIIIRGATGVASDVVIDGCDTYSFLRNREIYCELTVRDLTVKNCRTSDGEAGGAITEAKYDGQKEGLHCVVSNCVFKDCQGDGGGISPGAIRARCADITDCYFENCKAIGSGGGAVYLDKDNSSVFGCVFKNCSANGNGGGLLLSGDSVVENCLFDGDSAVNGGGLKIASGEIVDVVFTNCTATTDGCAYQVGTSLSASGVTVAKCSGTGAVCSGGNLDGALIFGCETTGNLIKMTYGGSDWKNVVMRDNTTVDDLLPVIISAHVISNCFITGNSATGSNKGIFAISSDGAAQLLIVDCTIKGNSCSSNRGAFYVSTTGTGSGVLLRNCYIGINDSLPCFFLNFSSAGHFVCENCTFIHNAANYYSLVRANSTTKPPRDSVELRNCFLWSKNNTYLPSSGSYNESLLISNCVFACINNDRTANGRVNLDPALGNRVLTIDELKLAGGSTVSNPSTFDWRPVKGSPLIDACTNQFDVAWVGNATKKRGPWDMGDGTWAEKPHATVTACAGMSDYETSFGAGVIITRNNANPRRYNGYLDVGCFEYYAAPGLLLLLK